MGDTILSTISIIFLLAFLLPFSSSSSSSKQEHGLVVNLVHRNRIDPLIYPAGSTPLERMDIALSRVTKTYKKVLNNTSSNPNPTSFPRKPLGQVLSKGTTFMAVIYIGSKRIYQYVALDTGSDILWVQCDGYNHGQITGSPTYDPVESDTHKQSTCLPSADYYCKKVPGGGECDSRNRCSYKTEYEDGSRSSGFMIFDTLTFYQNDRRTESTVPDVLFGCGIENFDISKEDGIFGIGADPVLSIIGKLGMRFSFCFGALDDEQYNFNVLGLGADAKLIGAPEPLILIENEFYVELKRITLGTLSLALPDEFTIMIDTGSSFSYVDPDLFDHLSTMVEQTVDSRVPIVVSRKILRALCYQDLDTIPDFPPLYLQLQRTILEIEFSALFYRTPEENFYCMTFLPFDTDFDVHMLGAAAMTFHNVGFDVNPKLVYFNKMDCRGLM